jgi:Bacteriocin class II with double-glycine leader peptide
MNAQSTGLRALRPDELAAVSGGFSADEFLASAGAGAAIGASIGITLLGPINFGYGAGMGAFVGGFFGGAYYAAGELIDYCF